MLTIKPAEPSSLRMGDLILVKTGSGGMLVHRLIGKRARGSASRAVLTKGDGLVTCDEPVPSEDILGKVIAVERTAAGGGITIRNLESLQWRLAGVCAAAFGIAQIVLLRLLRIVRLACRP
jgi:hypothetical protein